MNLEHSDMSDVKHELEETKIYNLTIIWHLTLSFVM